MQISRKFRKISSYRSGETQEARELSSYVCVLLSLINLVPAARIIIVGI